VTPILNKKLTLESPVLNPDGAGGWIQTWVAQGQLWAQVHAASGREKASNLATRSTVRYNVLVRGAPEGAPSRPRPEQRFTDGARIWRITAVKEADQRGQYLMCHAEEEVAS